MESKDFSELMEKFKSFELHNKTVTKFSEFFNDLCKDLNKSGLFFDLSKQFVTLKTDLERMQYVWNLPQLQDIEFSEQRLVCKISKFELSIQKGSTDHTIVASGDLMAATAAVLAAPYPYKQENVNSDTLVEAYATRSEILSRLGRTDDALKDIERAISFDCSPESGCFLYERIGKVYEHSNEFDKAIAAYTTARDICIENNNREMADIYFSLIRTTETRKSKANKPQTKRRAKSKKNVEHPQVPEHICEKFPLKMDSVNPDIPVASSAVSINNDCPSKKILVAARDIQPGELLVMEPPYAAGIIARDWNFIHCYHCFKWCDNPIPCYTCKEVSYCSEACMENGWTAIHMEECLLLENLSYEEDDLNEILTCLRIILKAGLRTLHGLFTKVVDGQKLEDLASNVYISNDYLTVYAIPCEEPFALHQFRNSVYAYLCLQLLDQQTAFFQTDSIEVGLKYPLFDFKVFVSSLLLRHLSNASYKTLPIGNLVVPNRKQQLTYQSTPQSSEGQFKWNLIGRGMYPLLALSNHSCDPNTAVTLHGTTAVMRSVRSIKNGEEISYEQIWRCFFGFKTKQERQEMILKCFKKRCECVACKNDYPKPADSMKDIQTLQLLGGDFSSGFNLKDSKQFDNYFLEFRAVLPKWVAFQERKSVHCSCPSTLELALSILEVQEKYCKRPNGISSVIEHYIGRIFKCQGNCVIGNVGMKRFCFSLKRFAQ